MTAPPGPGSASGAASVSHRDPASWRDPSGYVYRRDGRPFRQVAPSWIEEWRHFAASPLATRLVESGRLLGWQDASLDAADDPATAAAVIRPEPLALITFPYEWTFGQLRDAALLTLDVQLEALGDGWTLKDASAYNVQFRGVQPVLIDHLSFERAKPDAPWIAYRQFCEHFLAPLALMSRRDIRFGRILRDQLDGIPLELAARLLPGRTRVRLGLGTHLHLHARAQRQHAGAGASTTKAKLSAGRLRTLIESLRTTVAGLSWDPTGTEWADYAEREHTSYELEGAKADQVRTLLGSGDARWCWDLGANTGRYSRVAADAGYRVAALDVDPAAAERHYRALVAEGRSDITPLVQDLADPSPSQGWAERERPGLLERANADVIVALALVHHLAIGRNVPLPMVADLFAALAPAAIVEWIPREDPMVQRLLASREDIFRGYTEGGFRAAVERRFTIADCHPIEGSQRSLYHLRRR